MAKNSNVTHKCEANAIAEFRFLLIERSGIEIEETKIWISDVPYPMTPFLSQPKHYFKTLVFKKFHSLGMQYFHTYVKFSLKANTSIISTHIPRYDVTLPSVTSLMKGPHWFRERKRLLNI